MSDQFKKCEDMGPMDGAEFLKYHKKDLEWLAGFYACLDGGKMSPLGNKLHGMRRNIKRFSMWLNIEHAEMMQQDETEEVQ